MTRRETPPASGAATTKAAVGWPSKGRPAAVRFGAGVARGALALAVLLASVPGAGLQAQDVSYPEAARMYDGGQIQAAAQAFRDLAEAGNVAAQVSLAGMYETGEVTGTPNPEAAARWYRKAAGQGDPTAQMNLGDLYARGRGLPRDRVRAWVWLSRAADQGRDWAARRRDQVAVRMTAEQLARARSILKDQPGG